MNQKSDFDPFPAQPRVLGTRSWCVATGLQAVFTCLLLGASHWANGRAYEVHARLIVCLGIVTTWSLALRTIRERLLELISHWQKTSAGMLKKASASGRHFVKMPVNPEQERYIKAAIRRLRIIAAGLTIPFFTLPMMWTFIAAFLSIKRHGSSAENWATAACFMLFSALVVAGYFHWSIVPLPQPVRVSAKRRTG
ncbi:MAG: hypothetical protein WCT04_16460 [Planctomycetota bacterium]